jgi:hypothetical protein
MQWVDRRKRCGSRDSGQKQVWPLRREVPGKTETPNRMRYVYDEPTHTTQHRHLRSTQHTSGRHQQWSVMRVNGTTCATMTWPGVRAGRPALPGSCFEFADPTTPDEAARPCNGGRACNNQRGEAPSVQRSVYAMSRHHDADTLAY